MEREYTDKFNTKEIINYLKNKAYVLIYGDDRGYQNKLNEMFIDSKLKGAFIDNIKNRIYIEFCEEHRKLLAEDRKKFNEKYKKFEEREMRKTIKGIEKETNKQAIIY